MNRHYRLSWKTVELKVSKMPMEVYVGHAVIFDSRLTLERFKRDLEQNPLNFEIFIEERKADGDLY